jgi:hypothetical protein
MLTTPTKKRKRAANKLADTQPQPDQGAGELASGSARTPAQAADAIPGHKAPRTQTARKRGTWHASQQAGIAAHPARPSAATPSGLQRKQVPMGAPTSRARPDTHDDGNLARTQTTQQPVTTAVRAAASEAAKVRMIDRLEPNARSAVQSGAR